jgi:hypothetical protein
MFGSGSGMRKWPDPGKNIPDPQHCLEYMKKIIEASTQGAQKSAGFAIASFCKAYLRFCIYNVNLLIVTRGAGRMDSGSSKDTE